MLSLLPATQDSTLPYLRSNRIELEGRGRCEKGTNVLVNIPDKRLRMYTRSSYRSRSTSILSLKKVVIKTRWINSSNKGFKLAHFLV